MRRFAIFATVVLVLGLVVTGVAHADDPGPWADNIPPDPSTWKPMPPPSPLEQAVSGLKEATAAKVSKVNNLRRQNLVSHEEWWAALMEIRAEVDAAKTKLGLPVAQATQREIGGAGLAGLLYDSDYLEGMDAVDQECGDWCGPASAKEVLDYEEYAYGGGSYTLAQVAAEMNRTQCNQGGTCLGETYYSIEGALERKGQAEWQVHQPSSESGWFDDIVTSISEWSYPQVQLVRPNWDGQPEEDDEYLYTWENKSSTAHHYIAISGYNGIDGNVRYEESAPWDPNPGTYWWPASWVWHTLYYADASQGCASPCKVLW